MDGVRARAERGSHKYHYFRFSIFHRPLVRVKESVMVIKQTCGLGWVERNNFSVPRKGRKDIFHGSLRIKQTHTMPSRLFISIFYFSQFIEWHFGVRHHQIPLKLSNNCMRRHSSFNRIECRMHPFKKIT